MYDDDQGVLNQMFGDEAADKLGAVYGEMLTSLSGRGGRRIPPLEVRLAIASALVAQAGKGERDPARLMQAAIGSLESELESLHA